MTKLRITVDIDLAEVASPDESGITAVRDALIKVAQRVEAGETAGLDRTGGWDVTRLKDGAPVANLDQVVEDYLTDLDKVGV